MSTCLNAKNFWSFIGACSVMNINGERFTDPHLIVEAFLDQFSSVSQVSTRPPPDKDINHYSSIHFCLTSLWVDEILSAMKTLEKKLTSSFQLRDYATTLSLPLCRIFNLVLKTCTFPSA
ncbi:hypothetical protein Trydic_g14431 [Trypoxylus dichotomus]